VTTPTIETRPIANDYYAAADAHRVWFRKELVDLYFRASNDLARWAPEAERPAIRQFFIDNPIPVFGEKE